MAPEMVPLNRSLDNDFRFWPEDVEGSRAWARGLARAGVLTDGEAERIVDGLRAVSETLVGSAAADHPDEDVHSLVERLLGEHVGPLAGKLHSGRSRNDQSATDLRLWGMRRIGSLVAAVDDLGTALVGLAEGTLDVLIPGYTHLQPAQPIRGAHWALSHFWPLRRDRERLLAAGRSASVLPLGSGALAGCPFPVDRRALAEELGFAAISENSLDAVSDRDWIAETLFATALLGTHLSRLGEDLVLFGSREFGWLRIGDGYCTGSSLMPQKRNPDVAELTRGRSAAMIGALTQVLVLVKGLPSGYNRDLQEDKNALYHGLDSLAVTLPAITGAVASARIDPERAAAGLSAELLATDLAEAMVERGVPFRESHERVGRLVLAAEKDGVSLDELAPERLEAVVPGMSEWASSVLDLERSVERRASPGGTARGAVQQQLDRAREALAGGSRPGESPIAP